MGRAKAKPKKVPSTDLEGLVVTAAAPRKRGRPRKIVKEDQEDEATEEQEIDELEPKHQHDSNNEVDSLAQESERKLLDLLNKNQNEIGKAASQDKVPKKRGRPPKAQKSSTTAPGPIGDELAETNLSSSKKEFQIHNGIDDSEKPVKREGLSRRKSEPRRAAGFAAAR